MSRADQRAHIDGRVGVGRFYISSTGSHFAADRFEPLDQGIGRFANRNCDRARHATLAGAAERARLDGGGRLIQIGIGHHQQMILGPAG